MTRDISYLQNGAERQQEAYRVLRNLNIFEILAAYTPILVGTIPIDIDIADSDLDIICEVADLDTFEAMLKQEFAGQDDFILRRQEANGLPVALCNFEAGGFPVEIFGQPRPVGEQNAYRHMVAEGRLLSLAGDEARAAIRQLKRAGIKTEPAFGEYFALPGDPFVTLYELADVSDAELQQFIVRAEAIRRDCVFCRIARGEAEASIVYADASTLAFMNRRQANPGHVLVIPRRHVETIFDLDEMLAAQLSQTVVKTAQAIRRALNVSDLTIWQSNGPAAFQEIPHAHFHLFPRYEDDGYFQVYPTLPPVEERRALDELAARIKGNAGAGNHSEKLFNTNVS